MILLSLFYLIAFFEISIKYKARIGEKQVGSVLDLLPSIAHIISII